MAATLVKRDWGIRDLGAQGRLPGRGECKEKSLRREGHRQVKSTGQAECQGWHRPLPPCSSKCPSLKMCNKNVASSLGVLGELMSGNSQALSMTVWAELFSSCLQKPFGEGSQKGDLRAMVGSWTCLILSPSLVAIPQCPNARIAAKGVSVCHVAWEWHSHCSGWGQGRDTVHRSGCCGPCETVRG